MQWQAVKEEGEEARHRGDAAQHSVDQVRAGMIQEGRLVVGRERGVGGDEGKGGAGKDERGSAVE